MELLEFCQKLPKIELHAHLNGSLSPETLTVLNTPIEDIKTYQLLTKLDCIEDQLNLAFTLFKIAHNATNMIESTYLATKHVIEEFHKDNVIYLELRTTPRAEPQMTKRDYVNTIIKAIREQNLITVKLLLSINRGHCLKESEETLNLILEMHELYPDIIKGVDLSGNPNVGIFSEAMFIKARKSGLKITLHCAEVLNNEEVKQMLEFKPDRIGHGTFIHPTYGGSTENWKLCSDLRIPLECCLTSNVLCNTVQSYKEHHMCEWVENNLPFNINTDDKGVFSTTLTKEYFYAAHHLNLSKESLYNCSCIAIDSSFASEEEKLKLKTYLKEWKDKHLELF
ncbi:hypothetical protein RN001_000543 [Aquatica leii]|uniref:Adenosine deaminase domain-containing protein n=1 Tax=Aquatica leii TaxID=1421715 RepID=A0AAN7Q770_9COLE|nr:hypothetical protein RN001_000543 [Aquatica leii]